ncbi:MAG: ribonuclease III [Actinomycetia bacterium]|nr:ribonuclease III [Actinomycetes bacterium]
MSIHASADRLSIDDQVDLLARRLGHDFADPRLLAVALSHRSWCAENPGHDSNERLEFLGDAILGLVITEHLYATYELPEGSLAKMRAAIVSAEPLAAVARSFGMGDALRLGRGELQSGGQDKPSILADAMEAVIAAVHLDAGLDRVRRLVLGAFVDHIDAAASSPGHTDFKTRLQELSARRFGEPSPAYELVESGPDHEKRFMASVLIGGEVRGTGTGGSKKEAQQQAAAVAWQALSQPLTDPDQPQGN